MGFGSTVGLYDVEWDGAERHLGDFQDRCRAKKLKVRGTVAEAFDFATKWVSQESLADEVHRLIWCL